MKSSKIGIVTLYNRNYNCGGLLQAYALQKTIQNLGYDCRQIKVLQPDIKLNSGRNLNYYMKLVKDEGFSILFEGLLTKFSKKKDIAPNLEENRILVQKRWIGFDAFIDEIPHTETYTIDKLPYANDLFDTFVAGSDQIWNTDWFRSYLFLDFVQDSKKRISYAASMGRLNFSDEHVSKISELLKKFNGISLRERDQKEYVENLTGKEVEVVCDPTLLISASEWNQIETGNLIKEPYIFTYFLGNNKEAREQVTEYANLLNLKIVNMPFLLLKNGNDTNFADVKCYDAGPKEFVSLIKYADYVFTDSFHSTIFSIIYGKKFFVYKRNRDGRKSSMNSRIYNLLIPLNLESRIISSGRKISKQHLTSEIEYTEINKNIEEYRKHSLNYIMNSLK